MTSVETYLQTFFTLATLTYFFTFLGYETAWLWWLDLHIIEQIVLACCFLISLALSLFISKQLLVFVLQRFGCASPKLDHFLPRLPWRIVVKIKLAFSRWYEQTFTFGKYSTAGFASLSGTLVNTYHRKRLFVGHATWWSFGLYQSIWLPLNKHVLILAGTGSGKTSAVISMISKYQGSVFVLDPSSLITNALARCDKKRTWVRFAPYDTANTAQLNPMDDLKAAMIRDGSDAAVLWAYRIAYCFIKDEQNNKQPYFNTTSRGMLVGVILHVLTTYPDEFHNLNTVRTLIVQGVKTYNDDGTPDSSPEENRQILYDMMLNNPAFNFAVAGAASAFLTSSSETRGNLESTLLDKTKILDIPAIKHFYAKTTIPLSALKTHDDIVVALDISIYSLCEELNSCSLLIQNLICYTFDSIKTFKGDCLFVVDEVQAQGYNPTLEKALPTARSKHLLIVAITQDIEGLRGSYPKTYKSFLGNSAFILWMGTAHPDNLQQLNIILGKRTTITKDKRTGRKTYREVNVMEPEQLGRYLSPTSGKMIVTRSGKRPLKLKIPHYFSVLGLWQYDADINFKEPLLKAMMRFFLNRKPTVNPSNDSQKNSINEPEALPQKDAVTVENGDDATAIEASEKNMQSPVDTTNTVTNEP